MMTGGSPSDSKMDDKALDAMHQLLHIKLRWRLTERELEHIERVFGMFDGEFFSRKLFSLGCSKDARTGRRWYYCWPIVH